MADFNLTLVDSQEESARVARELKWDAAIPADAVTLALPATESAVGTVKLAALYFSAVRIRRGCLYRVREDSADGAADQNAKEGVVTQGLPLVGDRFAAAIDPLVREGVVHLGSRAICESSPDELQTVSRTVGALVARNHDLILEISDPKQRPDRSGTYVTVRFNNESRAVWEYYRWPLVRGRAFEFGFLESYYAMLMTDLMDSLTSGHTALSDSGILTELLKVSLTTPDFARLRERLLNARGIAPRLAQRVLQLALPDVSDLSCDDILELRYQARDELARFRSTILGISHAAALNANEDELLHDLGIIAETEVLPAMHDLERKASDSKLRVFKSLLGAMKNPTSYAPLIASVFHQVPAHLALLISLGVMGMDAALDMVAAKRELTHNGLYFLLQLRKKASASGTT